MAQYSTFKYGSGVKYGGAISTINLYKINTSDPNYAIKPRDIKLTVKHTTGAIWNVDTIRLTYARKEHVIPKWCVPVHRLIKRTKVTMKYTTDELWAIDSIRLKQMIRHRGPSQ